MTELRFPLARPRLGRARGGVALSDSAVSFEHPLLKQAVSVPLGQVAAVATLVAATEVEAVLTRDVRTLGLTSTGFGSVNLFLIMRAPAWFDGFKVGADRFFAISKRERRRGVGVDVVGVEVDDPEGLRAALAGAGVPAASSLVQGLVDVVGAATGSEREERIAQLTRQRRGAVTKTVLLGLVTAALFSARISLASTSDVDLRMISRMVVVAIAGAVVGAALGEALFASLVRRGDVLRRARGTLLLLPLAALGVLVVANLFASRWVGPGFVLAHAAVGAIAGGWLLGLAWHRSRPFTMSGDAPIETARSPLPPFRMLSVAGGVAVVALIAFTEPGVTGDLAIARRAVLTVEDLPPGWGSCCGAATYRGDDLDEHICGSPPGLPSHSAGFDREFTLNLTREGYEDGHLVSAVFLAPSTDAARREFASVDSPGYASCAKASVARSARITVRDPIGEPYVTLERTALPTDVPGIVDRFVSVFQLESGSDVVYTAFIRLQVDRLIVRMPVMTYLAPLDDKTLRTIIEVAERKARAAVNSTS